MFNCVGWNVIDNIKILKRVGKMGFLNKTLKGMAIFMMNVDISSVWVGVVTFRSQYKYNYFDLWKYVFIPISLNKIIKTYTVNRIDLLNPFIPDLFKPFF